MIMVHCDKLAICFFANDGLADMPYTADFMKNKYCKGEFTKCAQFTASNFFGRFDVPE
jgi:hypothetical protein